MNIYERCSKSISSNQLETIGKMYPFGTIQYRELRQPTLEFLQSTFPDAPEETEVIAISQHDGYGHQWGIILLQMPEEVDWQLVAHFGHNLGFIGDPYYYKFLVTGITMSEWRGLASPPAVKRLQDLPSHCAWLDDPYKEFRERRESEGA